MNTDREEEEFVRLRSEVKELVANLKEKDRHERGGITLGEMLDSGALAEAMVATAADPKYIRRQVRSYLESWLGDPESRVLAEGMFTNRYSIPINALDDQPEHVGTYAARAIGERKARNRIETLRASAKLCGDLASAFEARLREEGTIRRIQ